MSSPGALVAGASESLSSSPVEGRLARGSGEIIVWRYDQHMLLLPLEVPQAGHEAQVLGPETLVQKLVRQLRRRHRRVAAPPLVWRPGHVRPEEGDRRAQEDASLDHQPRVSVVRVDGHADAVIAEPDLDDRLRSRRDAQI